MIECPEVSMVLQTKKILDTWSIRLNGLVLEPFSLRDLIDLEEASIRYVLQKSSWNSVVSQEER